MPATTTGRRNNAGLSVSELKRLKALEEENRRLKQVVAEQALDNNRALKRAARKKLLEPGPRGWPRRMSLPASG